MKCSVLWLEVPKANATTLFGSSQEACCQLAADPHWAAEDWPAAVCSTDCGLEAVCLAIKGLTLGPRSTATYVHHTYIHIYICCRHIVRSCDSAPQSRPFFGFSTCRVSPRTDSRAVRCWDRANKVDLAPRP